jgi:hypothetical protein
MKNTVPVLLLLISTSSLAQKADFVIPSGDTMSSAKRIIFKEAEQPCGKILTAEKADAKFIVAKCSNGEVYLVSILKNAPMKDGTKKDVPIAGKCSAIQQMIGYKVKGCN